MELYETAPRETRTQENLHAFTLFILSRTNFQHLSQNLSTFFPPYSANVSITGSTQKQLQGFQ